MLSKSIFPLTAHITQSVATFLSLKYLTTIEKIIRGDFVILINVKKTNFEELDLSKCLHKTYMFWFKESKFTIASDIFIKYTFINLENSFKLYTKCCIINANMVTTHPLRILLIFHPSFLRSFQIPLRTICNLELETQIKIIDQQKISRIT